MPMHLHLDLLGGIAGDMFAASLLDARPALRGEVEASLDACRLAMTLEPASDGALSGRRFAVVEREGGPHRHDGDHGGHGHAHDHGHAHWRAIRARLLDGRLDAAVARRAVAIFEELAQAEARVHGVTADEVVFHEVGAADSIGDIVAAATLIEHLEIHSCSVGPVPTGSGRIETAHGIMPVPAPATALLLEGMALVDDGIAGERVTPTGAAILRHLAPRPRVGEAARLVASGFGFGTRRLAGISNCLRALLTETESTAGAGAVPHRRLAVVSFEVDDQTAEDLASGIERLRATQGVHDVVQLAAIGKKGRLATRLEVLADDAQAEAAIEACFRQTTTIGLRIARVEARALARRSETVELGGTSLRVKRVDRPGGTTGKAEADDVAQGAEDAAGRAHLRSRALAAGRP